MGRVIGAGMIHVQSRLRRTAAAWRSIANRRGTRENTTMSSALPPKFDISRDEIARVVEAFYAAARVHPGLGPVFAAHVTDWPEHEAKVTDFWANAILNDRHYDGNVMGAHVRAGNVKPGMFSTWLALFDTVLSTELDTDKAARWSALAHRIGRSLRAGVVERETLPGGIPKLR